MLEYATAHPYDDLVYKTSHSVQAQFASRTELILALQYDWSQALWAQIELLSLDTADGPRDADQLCGQPWRATAATGHSTQGPRYVSVA